MINTILCALALGLGTVTGPSAAIAHEGPPPIQPATTSGMLVEGTRVRLIFVQHHESGAAAKGEHVALQVAENVLDRKGRVLIKQGTPATGIVTRSRKAGIIARPGRLNIQIVSTSAVDGQTVPLRRIKSHTGHHRLDVAIEPGHEVVAYVDADSRRFRNSMHLRFQEVVTYVDASVPVSLATTASAEQR